jgi:aryl-alcohol dehydrogenase-like predicted oxidoreductase
MNYRQLGNARLTVSEIGFGAWGIGGLTENATSYGVTDDKESQRTLVEAFEQGITFYDTSNIYGNGHSEKLIAETLGPERSHIVIATKAGFTKHGGPHNLEPAYLRDCLEGSLRRLQTDYIDLYQLHSPPIAIVTDETVETLARFREEGKIREYGISLKDPDDGIPAITKFGFTALQVNFSMTDQRIRKNGLLETAEQHNVSIISRTPFNFGFLTDAPRATEFDARDHRSNWSKEQRERWADAPKFFASLNEGKNRTMAQLALRFCLSPKAVATVIPGMLHPQQVRENGASSELAPLTPDELQAIYEIANQQSFFVPREKT